MDYIDGALTCQYLHIGLPFPSFLGIKPAKKIRKKKTIYMDNLKQLLMMQLQIQLSDIIVQIIIMVSTEEKSEKGNGKNSKTSKPYNVSK